MAYKINDDCTKCGMCIEICPVGAISEENEKYIIEMEKCVYCNACVEDCPVCALKFYESIEEKIKKPLKIFNEQELDDEYYFFVADKIATNQEELEKITNKGEKTIYLYGDKFDINSSKTEISYIGINKPKVIYDVGNINYKDTLTGITFENVDLELKEGNIGGIDFDSVTNIRKLTRDKFEKKEDYDEKIKLLEHIHCGNMIIEKDNYYIDDEFFYVKANWFKCMKKIFKGNSLNEGYHLLISPEKAKLVYEAGSYQPIFANFIAKNGVPYIKDLYGVYDGEKFTIINCIEHFIDRSSGSVSYGLGLI